VVRLSRPIQEAEGQRSKVISSVERISQRLKRLAPPESLSLAGFAGGQLERTTPAPAVLPFRRPQFALQPGRREKPRHHLLNIVHRASGSHETKFFSRGRPRGEIST